MSSPSEGDFKEFILSDKLSDLENYNADNVLSEGLKEIYADVQLKCNDFRNNVFFKNVDNIDDDLVSYKNNNFFYFFMEHLIKSNYLILMDWEILIKKLEKLNFILNYLQNLRQKLMNLKL